MKWGRGLAAGGRDSGMLATGAGRGVSGLESLSFHTLGRVRVALVPAGPGPLTHPCPRPAPVLVSVASLSPGAPSSPGRLHGGRQHGACISFSRRVRREDGACEAPCAPRVPGHAAAGI